MSGNGKILWGEVSLESLKKQLWHLREVQVPAGLKTKLLDDIPTRETASVRRGSMLNWARNCGLAAAAVIFLAAMVCLMNYSGGASKQRFVADSNEVLRVAALVDQNNRHIDDTNGTNFGVSQ